MARLEASPDGVSLDAARLPFAEQIAFFRAKLKNLIPTRHWEDMLREAHDKAFMVAGATKADLLADLAAAVDKAISEGESIQTFRQRFLEIIDRHGWGGFTGDDRTNIRPKGGKGIAWRTRVIYQTNLLTSYSAGRLAQLKEGKFAYWVYHHDDSVRHPRPLHLAWDGLTLPADHPFWKTHWPPGGWGCQCYVTGARSKEAAARQGGNPDYDTPPKGWDVRDAKNRLPGIDEGWDYMPGESVVDKLLEQFAAKAAQWPHPISQAFKEEVVRYFHPSTIVRFEDLTSKQREKLLLEFLGEESYRYIKNAVRQIEDKRLTLADKIAIRAYTMIGWYRPLNAALREKDFSQAAKGMRKHKATIIALDEALSKLPDFTGTVKHGLRNLPKHVFERYANLKPGDQIRFTSYVSTSYEGGEFSGDVLLTIHAKTAKKIDHLSEFKHEKEALIPRGRQFKVINVEKDGGRVYIELEELADKEWKDLLPSHHFSEVDLWRSNS